MKTYDIVIFLEIPHFGRTQQVNACIKKLLRYVHGENIWLDEKV